MNAKGNIARTQKPLSPSQQIIKGLQWHHHFQNLAPTSFCESLSVFYVLRVYLSGV